MGRVDDIARRFSLAGVLDDDAKTRSRFPVRELDVASVSDHPDNTAYSMDEDAVSSLAESIRRDGLTDIPLVRRLPDGGFQMISGHRRKAAYALLAEQDPAFSKMPCRIIEGIDDAQASTLLHTANYFTRELSVVERARATRALGLEVKRMRESDPSLKGARTSELKAAIIRAQTGRDVAGRTIEHHEAIARIVEDRLSPPWQRRAQAGRLSDSDIQRVSKLPRDAQESLARSIPEDISREEASALIRRACDAARKTAKKQHRRRSSATAQTLRSKPDKLLGQALELLGQARAAREGGASLDGADLDAIEREVAAIRSLRARGEP